MVRAIAAGKPVVIRNPQATRPWQHVLEPLSGYLLLGQKLLQGYTQYAEAWNFGPADEGSITVGEVVRQFKANWDAFTYELRQDAQQPHEAGLLKLDCSKARALLNWQPVWNAVQALENTAAWYRMLYTQNAIQSEGDLNSYIQAARQSGVQWARG
jgi:CDP-glucose 4,6-dehydratase